MVQAGLTEGAHGPGVVVVSREGRLPSVQPRNPRAVKEMRPADLSPRQSSVRLAVGHSGSGRVGVVWVSL